MTTTADTTPVPGAEPVSVRHDPPSPRARLSLAVVRRIAGWYLLSRLAVLLAAQAAIWTRSHVSIYQALTRWDSSWYGTIAMHGYPSVSRSTRNGNVWAFFPAWPFLLRAVHGVFGGTWQRNGLALAFVLGFTAAVGVWLFVADVFGAVVADRTVALFLFMPSAFTLSMVYTEALFVTCCTACLYALQRKWWVAAGVAAAIGGATRLPGVVLLAGCGVAAFAEIWSRRAGVRAALRPLLAPLIAPLGLIAFVVAQWIRVGTPVEFIHAERVWNQQPRWGLALIDIVRELVTSRDRFDAPTDLVVVTLVLFLLAGFVAMALDGRRVPVVWWVYSVGIVFFAVLPTVIGPRYLLPALPPVACLLARLPARWFPAVLATSALFMLVVAMLSFGAAKFLLIP